jgi:hypothetical protein
VTTGSLTLRPVPGALRQGAHLRRIPGPAVTSRRGAGPGGPVQVEARSHAAARGGRPSTPLPAGAAPGPECQWKARARRRGKRTRTRTRSRMRTGMDLGIRSRPPDSDALIGRSPLRTMGVALSGKGSCQLSALPLPGASGWQQGLPVSRLEGQSQAKRREATLSST